MTAEAVSAVAVKTVEVVNSIVAFCRNRNLAAARACAVCRKASVIVASARVAIIHCEANADFHSFAVRVERMVLESDFFALQVFVSDVHSVFRDKKGELKDARNNISAMLDVFEHLIGATEASMRRVAAMIAAVDSAADKLKKAPVVGVQGGGGGLSKYLPAAAPAQADEAKPTEPGPDDSLWKLAIDAANSDLTDADRQERPADDDICWQ